MTEFELAQQDGEGQVIVPGQRPRRLADLDDGELDRLAESYRPLPGDGDGQEDRLPGAGPDSAGLEDFPGEDVELPEPDQALPAPGAQPPGWDVTEADAGTDRYRLLQAEQLIAEHEAAGGDRG